MPTWNIVRYRLKAVHWACEFLQLYPIYRDSVEALRFWIIKAGAKRYWACVKKHDTHLCDLLFAMPARKRATLAHFRRLHSKSRDPSADVLVGMLILAGWQIFRKAVLHYDRIGVAGETLRPQLTTSYKSTALFIAREPMHRPWTHWPPQWGPSPLGAASERVRTPRVWRLHTAETLPACGTLWQ